MAYQYCLAHRDTLINLITIGNRLQFIKKQMELTQMGCKTNPFQTHEEVVNYVTILERRNQLETKNHSFYVTRQLQREYLDNLTRKEWSRYKNLTIWWGRRLNVQEIVYNSYDDDDDDDEDLDDTSVSVHRACPM